MAVAAVLDHLEAHGSTTRIRRNGSRAFVDTGGLTMATSRHSTSREDDPQIHTHPRWISTKVQTAVCTKAYERALRAVGPHSERLGEAQFDLDEALRTEVRPRYARTPAYRS